MIHAVKTRMHLKTKSMLNSPIISEEPHEEGSKPLCESLVDLDSSDRTSTSEDSHQPKAHFFVYCSQCTDLCTGKLRVRCGVCGSGAFTVHRDPENWDDVLKKKRITGHCENYETPCVVRYF